EVIIATDGLFKGRVGLGAIKACRLSRYHRRGKCKKRDCGERGEPMHGHFPEIMTISEVSKRMPPRHAASVMPDEPSECEAAWHGRCHKAEDHKNRWMAASSSGRNSCPPSCQASWASAPLAVK